MQWEKLGMIWAPNGHLPWAQSHATLPIVHVTSDSRWWVYVGCRDANGKTRVGRVVVDVTNLPSGAPTIVEVDPTPVLLLGEPGTFDDSGVMPSWLVASGDEIWLYYIGWNVSSTVPYRLSIGLAVSRDGGVTFARYAQGPIVDRNPSEPYFVTTPCVIRENGRWRMWYTSCTGWQTIAGRLEPAYHVKYAESDDGISWNATGISCVDLDDGFAVARPCVFPVGSGYGMLYSYRSLTNYRTDRTTGYRIGYAESSDGIRWKRADVRVGIDRSTSGWDAEMIEYCWLQQFEGNTYLLYNGNGFGQSGFGIARLTAWD